MVKKKVFALYVLQFKRSSMSRNLMENGDQNGSKKRPKWNQKSPGRRMDLLDFGAFWEEVFFRRFLRPEKVGSKSGKIQKKVSEGAWDP